MDTYENMYKSICRLCLSVTSGNEMVSLIDISKEKGLSCFGESITILTNVKLQKDDKLPTMMCQMCVVLLKQAIYFKLKCESTDKKLKQLMNDQIYNDTSDQDLKEIVCEYVMFNQYFPNTTPAKGPVINKTPRNGLKTEKSGRQNALKSANIKARHNSNRSHDYDDFLNDSSSNHSAKHGDNEEDMNCVLNTIQNIINTPAKNSRSKRKFKREGQLIIPSKQRNIKCKICLKVLANRLTYDHHMQRHSNCRYICDQCGKGFPVLTDMHEHQLVRHGIGPYLKCDHCPYKAPKKSTLIEHLRLHTGERPFTCEKCGLTFRRRAIWRNHLVHHMEKKVQCTYCPKKFYRQSHMLAHCNNVHERLYMFMCNICNVTYAKTETVRRHMLVKHGIPKEKQGKVIRIKNGSTESPGILN
ncbi:unnamed protein product [Chrysodeixis includens]|uniref:Uncharacterized protein n=1 Tax=Chrysodeixis includens TaxID=689277 RepID=A0A9N8L0A1_CHRIL|nr:unnamed protein product [Chrysodeixis includens]